MAQQVQANLKAVGFNVELAGSHRRTWLQKYRDGEDGVRALALGPRLPRSADYLAFMPGELVGLARRLAEGRRPDDREARRPGMVTTGAPPAQTIYRRSSGG